MKQFNDKTQKIIAGCILQKDGKILLLRSSQLVGTQADVADTGYFDIPHFEIAFGENPESLIKNYFASCFNHIVETVTVIDVRQNVVEEDAVQVFKIIYKIQCDTTHLEDQKPGVFFFADIEDLESYMLSDHYKYITEYI